MTRCDFVDIILPSQTERVFAMKLHKNSEKSRWWRYAMKTPISVLVAFFAFAVARAESLF